MMCKEMKKDLKSMKSLRDDGRYEGENRRNVIIGFLGDDDYHGALLVDGERFMVRNG